MAIRRIAAVLIAFAAMASAGSPWPDTFTQQAQKIVNQMSLDELVNMAHGHGTSPYVGDVPGLPSLGIPSQNQEDGPQGVADGVQGVTCWPSALTAAMSWDPAVMFAFGQAMGREQYLKGTNFMLGPGVNIARVPWGGRTFEYLGEDPYLASQLVASEVLGIQSNNISAVVKHFVCNNQEYERGTVSENVPQRAQWELYYPAFKAAVDVGVGAVMCSYNRINNTWSCENAVTLGDLKGPNIGFRGFVMSDWGGTHSTVQAALAGLDQEEPDSNFFGDSLTAAVKAGTVPQSRVQDMVVRMLTPMLALGLFANPPTPDRNLGVNVTSDAHNALARWIAEQSITLLKNDGLLPVNRTSVKTVAVIGDASTVHGGGSGGVIPPYIITPFQGVYQLLNGNATRPVNCQILDNTDFFQPGNECVGASSVDDCCAQCTQDPSCVAFTYVRGSACGSASGSACWKHPTLAGQVSHDGMTAGICAPWPAGAVNVTFLDGTDLDAATALATVADLVIVNVATTSSEGTDRTNLSLPLWQDTLVDAISTVAGEKTVVVARCPGACFMPWLNSVSAVLYQLMPGQESGNALAAAIFGDINPSGKLPLSFPSSMTDTWLSATPGGPVTPSRYPGTQRSHSWLEADYEENLLVGYRWYDSQNWNPLFPFGHGLSYTTFKYANIAAQGTVSPSSNVTVSLTLVNTGAVAGAEVVQLYVAYPAAAGEPPKLLKGFQKRYLAPNASAQLTFTLASTDLSIWDVTIPGWRVVPGTYVALIGSSSRDLRGSATFSVAA